MDAARALMAQKKLAAASSDALFWTGLEGICSTLLRAEAPRDRLLAAELLVRLSKALKAHRDRIISGLRLSLVTPLPDLREMPAPSELGFEFKASEARENIALALGYIDFPWVEEYRLRAFVQEDRSEEVRNLLATQIFASADSLEGALLKIGLALESHCEDVESPTVAARRTKEILSAIAIGVRSSVLDGTSEVGSHLERVARPLLERTGVPKQTRPIEECVAALTKATEEFLRPRIHLAIDGQSYQALRLIPRWWGSTPYSVSVVASVAPIVKHLRSAVLLLGRMGQRSDSLVVSLTTVLGSRGAAAELLQELERLHPELEPSIRQWLRAGGRDPGERSVHGLERLQSAVSRDVDLILANLMRTAHSIHASLTEPNASTVTHTTEQLRQLLRDIDEAAYLRSLNYEGRVGDIVNYSPSFHEKMDHSQPHEARVRILTPAVVRKSGDSVAAILLKAVVTEP